MKKLILTVFALTLVGTAAAVEQQNNPSTNMAVIRNLA
ncbi:hypothetical protein SAMN00790413_00322 [Deinococcus hopiensis KR-140]|uniref:Uncharacterized protein n=1 Tax=Deinococcus hopiensis KR-140 TaxID=695939 RepID=A0A1W1V794_9DEIO|nr:hypothetical protein SAMN00790413_00322 [Deinococcus hopiensis KR-140]